LIDYFQVVEKNTTGWKRVVKLFGNEILNSDQSINREKLGQIVFSDPTKRRQLNRCLHGLIRLEMLKEVLFYLIKGNFFEIKSWHSLY
jgi:dephospho-CoA kinase